MRNNQLTCDPTRIELFLEQRLSDTEQTAFELHLDGCDHCRRRLESAAANDDVWSAVRDSLGGEPLSMEWDGPACDGQASGDPSFSRAAVLGLLAPTDDERMLGRLGTYEVVGIIGSGGMGVVLKAFDAALNRYVAIKVLAPHLGASGAARRRFSREAQAAAAVVHENVMEIYGVDDAAGLPYLVMPYVRGPSLQRRLDEQGPLALAEILRIGMQAAAGLAAAHVQGLVHRDVKPANILLADGVERVKLTDFGLARAADDASLTRTGFIAGTPQYMSPEQARGDAVDARSDLFSLGSVLYAMCTGRTPFRAETSYGVLRRITDEEPRPIREINPEVPEWLCRIISRLMAKQADQRCQSAREVALLLEACLAHVQQPTAAPLPEELRQIDSSADAKTPNQPRRASGRFTAAWHRRFQEPRASAPRPISLKALLAAVFVVALLFAGVVIVLELNKGTLTIESEVDDVSVRITRGDDLVERLTVKQTPEKVRIAAGTYVVEIDGKADGIAIENGVVKLERGGREIVRIVKTEEASPSGSVAEDHPDPDDRQSLEYAAKQFNAMTAKERRKLFNPPIADLTVERLREGFRQSAELYGAGGKRQIAKVLRQIAESGRLPEEAAGGLFSSGVHAQDDNGETVSQQIVPSLILPDGVGNRLVVLRPLELFYKKGGPVSKDYGDLSDPKEDLAASSGRAAVVPEPGPYAAAPPGVDPMAATPLRSTTPQATAPAPRPVRRFATGLTGHALVLAYSPDGRRLAVANGNPTRVLRVDGTSYVEDWKPATRILDADTGDIVLSLELATAEEAALLTNTPQLSHFEVTAMAFSPDGEVLAIGTDIGQVKLFDVATGALVRSFDHEQEKLVDAETPKTLKSLPRAIGSVASLAFSPDGALLAVCGETFEWFGDRFDRIERGGLGRAVSGPGRLKVWDVATGNLAHDLAGHSHAYAVAFSPDGATLASAGSWEGAGHGTGVIFWQVKGGAQTLVKPTLANGGARWMAISPDGKLAAIGSQVFDKDAPDGGSMGDIALIHTASGITEWQTRVPRWGKPLFSADGQTLAVLCGGPAVRFLNAQTGQTLYEIRAAEGVQWVDFAASPQGRFLAIGAVDRELRGMIEICDFGNAGAPDPDRPGPVPGTPDPTIRPIAPSTDGAKFSVPQEVLLSMDSIRFMLDFDTGRTMDPPATIRPEQGFMDVCTDQVQPYQLPRGLTGFSLHGIEVKPSDWDAMPSVVRRRLAESARPLSQMNHFPTSPATYFFRTRDGAEGVLQLLDLVAEPKGIRIRYKTLVAEEKEHPR